ncbi:GHKL domain-containing protein [Paenibacillus athensensis]|uniref:histidine kinase n=1 Tax=Paenibacillus athensensis TaxID=1967502 RepID=A0A4Y8Q8V7_9BACL|nr:ATP-binding protein [Paenibacillus athensensis]MCD1260117.1 GHKL domain-containing protein [Paenibacillus athensensis]
MDNKRRKLPSLGKVCAVAVAAAALHQMALWVLGVSMQVWLWSLGFTLLAAGGVGYGYGRVFAAFSRAEAQLDKMVESWRELEQSEKLTMAGTLAAGIAHEIRNPLTSLRGFLQLMRQREPQYTEIMLSEVDRINEIVSELLELAHPKETLFELHGLQPILQNAITLLDAQSNLHNVQLTGRYAKGTERLVVLGKESKLKQVFINLIKNAIEAMPDGGRIRISLAASDAWACIEIVDSGLGIPPELLERIGQPFVTTKERGNGLGLVICKRIIEDHQGTIEFASPPEGGTVVTVKLPIQRT